jgi:metal-sulfur cluster biosynthetic enzyme
MPATTEEEVLTALKDCYDPEIPVNIVDLGLIYGVKFEPAELGPAELDPAGFDPAEKDKQDVTIDLTLTSQGCPAHVSIGEQIKARLMQLPGIRNANVNVVWSPPWTPERISPDARKQLGIE